MLLETTACGTPVVATDVGGVRGIVTDSYVGQTVAGRHRGEFAAALRRFLRGQRRAADLARSHASRFAWSPIVHRYYDILLEVARGVRPQPA